MKTRTGNYAIGWRRRNYAWEQDLDGMIAWAKANDLEVIDLGREDVTTIQMVLDAGLLVGSVDLPIWGEGMISADKSKRANAVARNREYVETVAGVGVRNFFAVLRPDDTTLPPQENFGYMVESFGQLAEVMDKHDAHLVIEGHPPRGTMVSTPESFAAIIEQIPSPAIGITYDPSHLIRQGIDPLRFLREFVDRVYHVHGKDARIISENLYRYGWEVPAIFADKLPYGEFAWRYTIPSHGLTDWVEVCHILHNSGYSGCISVELEDMNFDDNESSKLGILQAAQFLTGC